jgi:hypothetical protein
VEDPGGDREASKRNPLKRNIASVVDGLKDAEQDEGKVSGSAFVVKLRKRKPPDFLFK